MKDNQAKYPQLRFKGFTDPWEQRKLGEIAVRVRGNDGRMNLPTLTISAGNGWMDQRDRFSQNISGKEQKNYTLLRQGELSYNHGNSKLAQFGAVFELESYNEALVPRVYHSFSVTAGAQPKFIEQMFATHRPDRELRKLVSSGARMDGLLNINYDDFMGIKVWLPSVAEQQAIAGLLVKLDNTIALHQRKLTKLKELKQGYLQKMFPKNGSKFPQLRFAGFADDWEERKLRGILAERNDQITETNEYPLMSFVQGKGVTPKGKRYNRSFLVKDVDKKYKKTELGDFIYSSNNLETGSIGFNRTGKAVISPVYSIFKSKREQESQFIGIMSARKDFIFKMIRFRQGVVYGQWRIHESDFLNIDIRIPSYEEQQSIICFFEKLNKAIDLHQRKLDLLKEQKKGFLQKMFV